MNAQPHVYVNAWNAVTPLGSNISTLYDHMLEGKSSCQQRMEVTLFPEPFCASLFDRDYPLLDGFSKLETLIVRCLEPIVTKSITASPRTIFIFSSTKGNVDALQAGKPVPTEAYLWHTAEKIARYFENPNKPLTVSNACVSGIMAQNVGFDALRSGTYDHAVVFGADLITDFVLSGFGCFKAMSPEPSKPFDKERIGINLGEGAGAVLLSTEQGDATIKLTGTGSGNDANHISGPSRTGDGLCIAINAALKEANINASQIDYLSAHGTATPYNDEMESLAFTDAGLTQTPLNSLKGYFGHTLGAAGLIETAVLLESMKRKTLLPSLGYTEHGVTGPIQIISTLMHKPVYKALKTGSGFGGCNAVSIFELDKG